MSTLQALFIAILQGATELFPISSLGHAVVVPALLGLNIDQRSADFLPFVVLLHTGTAVALITYFWRDWWSLFLGFIGVGGPTRVREARRMVMLLVVATIPAVVLGASFASFVRALFASPLIVCGFLVINGLLLVFGERLRARAPTTDSGIPPKPLSQLSVLDALIIGLWQCLALFPGISRAGATMVAGLLRGLDHAGAAHFSFLIATPIIVGATVHEVPHLLHTSVSAGVFQQALIAAVLSGITAYLTTAFLMRYFRNHDKWALTPFAIYCFLFGAGSALVFVLR